MQISVNKGISRVIVNADKVDVYHRNNPEYPGITLIVQAADGSNVTVYLTPEQSTSLSESIKKK